MNPRESGIWAAAVTSLKMENLGPFNRPISEVEAFIHEKYNHSPHFALNLAPNGGMAGGHGSVR